MSATNIQANWSAVSFPTSGTPLTQIDDVTFDKGGDVSFYQGDGAIYNTLGVVLKVEPTATIETSNPYQFMSLAPGAAGTLTATHNDAKLATGGGIVYTLSNAIFKSAKTSGPHGSFGKCTAEFVAVSTDGTTSPLGWARV